MKRFLMIFCISCMIVAFGSCTKSNNNEDSIVDRDVVFVPKDVETKAVMTPGLINSWENGDKIGVFATYGNNLANGMPNAQFSVSGAPDKVAIKQGFVPQANKVLWKDYSLSHSFYLYSPYVAGVARDAVTFSITSNQTQNEKHVWHNTNPYNFQWDALVDISALNYGINPGTGILRFDLKRMLPVCEFVITKQEENIVKGYSLESIELVQDKSVTDKKLKTGAMTIDLNRVGTYNTTSPLFANLPTTVNSYKLTTNIAMDDVKLGEGFSMFMSINPIQNLGKHSVLATFKNAAGDVKKFYIERADENFTVVNGEGNIVRYYFSIGGSPEMNGDTTISLGIGINPHIGGSDIDLTWN